MTVTVAPPVVTAVDGSAEAVENRDPEVILPFLSQSFPQPQSLVYERDGKPVSFSNERIIALTNGSVRLLNPTRADSGNYTLTVTNTRGYASASILLTIHCENLRKCITKAS